MSTKIIDHLLSRGDLGLLLLLLITAIVALWKFVNSLKKVVESNTTSNVAVAHALDKMAAEVSASTKQNAEVQRAVLETFARQLSR